METVHGIRFAWVSRMSYGHPNLNWVCSLAFYVCKMMHQDGRYVLVSTTRPLRVCEVDQVWAAGIREMEERAAGGRGAAPAARG